MKQHVLTLSLVLAACANAPNPAVDLKYEEAAIRKLDEQWAAAATKKDVAGAVAVYATDGLALWQDQPAVQGEAGLKKMWADDFAMKGMGAWAFVPERIVVAQSGDIATDQGRAEVNFTDDKGVTSKIVVKYLVVWKKENGQWKVLYDMWNSNAPLNPS